VVYGGGHMWFINAEGVKNVFAGSLMVVNVLVMNG